MGEEEKTEQETEVTTEAPEDSTVEETEESSPFDLFDEANSLNPPDEPAESEDSPVEETESTGDENADEKDASTDEETTEATDEKSEKTSTGDESAEKAPPAEKEEKAQPEWLAEKRELEKKIADLSKVVTTLAADKATQPATGKEKTEGKEEGQLERFFNIEIPDTIIEHITNEDPAQVRLGLKVLINGVADVIRQQLTKERDEFMDSRLQNYTQTQQAVEQRQTEVKTQINKYYEEYPSHLTGHKPKIVQLALAELIQEDPSINEWSEEVRARVARKVFEITGDSGKGPAPKPAVQETTGQVKETPSKKPADAGKSSRPPRMTRPGARPSSTPAKTGRTMAEEVSDLISVR